MDHDQPRTMSVDYLRVILAAFVVLAHSGLARETLREGGLAGLWGLAAGNGILRVAVPVFTLIAGYYLTSTLRRGRLSGWVGHLLLLYAVWSAVYLLFLWPYYAARPVAVTLTELLLGFMHLWFLQGLALSGVILGLMLRLGQGAVIGSALLLGLAGLALQYARMSGVSEVPVEHYRNGPLYLYPYLVMGWLLARRPPRLSIPVLGALAAAGLVLTLAENIAWLGRIGEDPLLEIPIGHLILCPALLLLVLRVPVPVTTLPWAQAAAGIYGMHVIVLQGLPRIGLPDPALGTMLGIVLPFGLVWTVVTLGGRRRRRARPV